MTKNEQNDKNDTMTKDKKIDKKIDTKRQKEKKK